MRGLFLLPVVMTAGCLSGSKGELWLFQMGTLSPECVEQIDENFIDASAPDGEVPDENWTYADTFTLSDRLMLGTVLHGRGGSRTLILDGAVYPGTVEKGVTTFTWEGSTDSESKQVHDAGYTYVSRILSSSTVSISLEKDSETKGQTGSISTTTAVDLEWVEDDEWAFEAVGLPGGQIPAFLYLDGPGVVNDPTREDCTGVSCSLAVTETCSGSAPVQATWMGRTDNSGYGDLQDAEMPYGAAGAGGTSSSWTY